METRTRSLNWSVSGDEVRVTAIIDEKRYGFFANPETRDDVLRDVGLLAADPLANLTWDDAAEITALIRDLLMDAQASKEQMSDAADLGLFICMVLPGIVFWGVLAALFWAVMSFAGF